MRDSVACRSVFLLTVSNLLVLCQIQYKLSAKRILRLSHSKVWMQFDESLLLCTVGHPATHGNFLSLLLVSLPLTEAVSSVTCLALSQPPFSPESRAKTEHPVR